MKSQKMTTWFMVVFGAPCFVEISLGVGHSSMQEVAVEQRTNKSLSQATPTPFFAFFRNWWRLLWLGINKNTSYVTTILISSPRALTVLGHLPSRILSISQRSNYSAGTAGNN